MTADVRPDMLVITDETTRAELVRLLASACHGAKRDFPVVGPTDAASRWDDAHAYINELLDDLEQAPE
jgi:hypothetical protein